MLKLRVEHRGKRVEVPRVERLGGEPDLLRSVPRRFLRHHPSALKFAKRTPPISTWPVRYEYRAPDKLLDSAASSRRRPTRVPPAMNPALSTARPLRPPTSRDALRSL